MEILEEVEKKLWSRDIECKECKSRLKIYETDLWIANIAVNTGISYKDETSEFRIYANCAVCKKNIDVTKYVPSKIKYAMEKHAMDNT